MQHQNQNVNVFLFGAIFNVLASIDFSSLLDYTLKAIIGGGIWLCFQVLIPYFQKITKNKQENDK